MKNTAGLNKKYNEIIKQGLVDYYKNRSLYHREIDLEPLSIQIEAFTWKSASYRIDIFHRSALSFIPYNSSFSWAHRMWMSESGSIIKSEPVYEISNPKNADKQKTPPAENSGFFPGNSHYHKELDFIDHALKKAGAVYRFETNSNNTKSLSIDVSAGYTSLKEYSASIIENADSFTIRLDIQQTDYQYIAPFDLLNKPGDFNDVCLFFIFDIDKSDGQLSGITFEKYTPPSLC
ncbi:hypothetical protein MNBD_GAMMA09-1660 [hydrothermal vent metagenome]|uniref:Uncharacterized protein n=1 Tax=hydrothermal vent metagenome TaxID=652676 RepID=A0A3B0XYX0_9ZZZZ